MSRSEDDETELWAPLPNSPVNAYGNQTHLDELYVYVQRVILGLRSRQSKKKRYSPFKSLTSSWRNNSNTVVLSYLQCMCSKPPRGYLKPQIVPNTIYVLCFILYIHTFSLEALHGFCLVYRNCQHNYSCSLVPSVRKILERKLTWTQALCDHNSQCDKQDGSATNRWAAHTAWTCWTKGDSQSGETEGWWESSSRHTEWCTILNVWLAFIQDLN